jgi:hypothetical protein
MSIMAKAANRSCRDEATGKTNMNRSGNPCVFRASAFPAVCLAFSAAAAAAPVAPEALVAPAAARRAHADAYFTAVDLGFVVAGAGRATPLAINAWAQVGGYVEAKDGTGVAFVTGPKGRGVYTFGREAGSSTVVRSLNDRGDAAGTYCSRASACYAFAVGPKRQEVRWLSSGAVYTHGMGITASGEVAGRYDLDDYFYNYAFVTGDRARHVRTLDIDSLHSWANAVNDRGQVVGRYLPAGGGISAFLMDSQGTLLDLGLPYAEALGINAGGQVVGITSTRAFVTDRDGENARPMASIDGADQTTLVGINAHGRAVGYEVGYFEGNYESHGIVTDLKESQLYRLDLLVDLPAGVYLETASAINDHDEIVAQGSDGHVYLLEPVRSSD